MQTDELKLYDIYGVWYRPFWQQPWFYIALIILGLIIICIGLYCIYKIYFAKKNKISVEQQVLNDIEKIEHKDLQNRNDLKQAYFEVTIILKKYLSYRYDISLHSLTDAEVMQTLQNKAPQRVVDILHRLLDAIVRVKFADYTAEKKNLKSDLEAIKTIILETKIIENKKG